MRKLIPGCLVHLQDALRNGANTCLVRTVDTDVVVVLIGNFYAFISNHPAADLWVAFGTRKSFMYLHINTICNALGREKSMALPIFHSFTGCDTTSGFFGKGKKSAWDAWKSYPEVTQAFVYVSCLLWKTNISNCLNVFASFYTTRQVIWNQLLSRGGSCSVKRTRQWKLSHQHNKMLFCSIASVLSTRLVSGQPVTWLNNRHLVLKGGVGH